MVNRIGNVDQIKGSVRDYVSTYKFYMKLPKKVEVLIGRNVVNITIKMRSIDRIFKVIMIICMYICRVLTICKSTPAREESP